MAAQREVLGKLPAVSSALVGDVANVVRIETLRSTPLLVDGSMNGNSLLTRRTFPFAEVA